MHEQNENENDNNSDKNIIEKVTSSESCVKIVIEYCKKNTEKNIKIEDYYVILMYLMEDNNCTYKKFNELAFKLLEFVEDWSNMNYNPFSDQYFSIAKTIYNISDHNFKGLAGFYTPLSIFCKSGNLEMVKNLVNMGHDINRPYHGFSDPYCITYEYEEGLLSPLAMAAKYGHNDICIYLSSKDAIHINQYDYVSEVEYKQSGGKRKHTLHKQMKKWNEKMKNEFYKKN
jgi:Ankyrin repeats (3 copies)